MGDQLPLPFFRHRYPRAALREVQSVVTQCGLARHHDEVIALTSRLEKTQPELASHQPFTRRSEQLTVSRRRL